MLAAVELSSSLWDIGHHHGLAMLSLSRGAHAVTDLTQSGADAVETVVEVVSEVGAEAAAAAFLAAVASRQLLRCSG